MPKGICYNANRQERRKCSLWHAKSPGVATSGAFLFRCGKVAYALGWLPPIYLRPAICRCSRRDDYISWNDNADGNFCLNIMAEESV
jgi:hypothetical protein